MSHKTLFIGASSLALLSFGQLIIGEHPWCTLAGGLVLLWMGIAVLDQKKGD
jgi:hypothetical protein